VAKQSQIRKSEPKLAAAARKRHWVDIVVAAKTSNEHLVGGVLIVLSAISYSTAGFFTRIISTDLWTMLCLRGFFASAFLLIYLLYMYRGRTKEIWKQVSWPAAAATVASALAMICNLGAYRNTAVANVVVIYAMSPFIAAALAWLLLREPFPRRTLIASLVSLVGVVIMMGGSVVVGHLLGDFLAIGMTLFMSCMMVAIRYGAAMDMIPASFMSAVASMIITLPFAHIANVSGTDWTYLAAFGVTQLGLGLLFLTEGSRRIPAAQVALIGSLDIPFAILLVWLAFSEVSPPLTHYTTVIWREVGNQLE
jgi:drug/metabolite transporter (DMT)-like permease